MDSPTRASDRLRPLHVSSAAVLLFFLAWHLWEVAAAPFGREALVERMSWHDGGMTPPLLVLAFVLVPFLAHLVSGVGLARAARPEAPSGYLSHGSRKLQWLSGLVLLGFVALHLADTWWFELTSHADAGQMHDRLRARVGIPAILAVYVIGTGALVLHVSQGLMALLTRRMDSTGAMSPRRTRFAAALVALVSVLAFLVFVNTIGYFAAGRGPILDPSEAGASSVD